MSREQVELRNSADWWRHGIAEVPVQVVQVRVLWADGQPKYAYDE